MFLTKLSINKLSTKGAVMFELALILLPLCCCEVNGDYSQIRRENGADENSLKVFQKENYYYTAYFDFAGASLELKDSIELGDCDHLPINNDIIQSNCKLFIPNLLLTKDKDNDRESQSEEQRPPSSGSFTIKAYCENGLLDLVLTPTKIPRNDMRFIFDVDNTEYIVLNYFYVKLVFLGLLITTGLLISVEIRDVLEKMKQKRRNKQFVRLIEDDV